MDRDEFKRRVQEQVEELIDSEYPCHSFDEGEVDNVLRDVLKKT